MKKAIILFLFAALITPQAVFSETFAEKPSNALITRSGENALISWKNPESAAFAAIEIFRTDNPIETYLSYEAILKYCDKIYEGTAENFTDSGLAPNLPYYYILFARAHNGNISKALLVENKPGTAKNETPQNNNPSPNNQTLAGAPAATVNEVSRSEAGMVYNFNTEMTSEPDENSRRLALFIIVRSPHDLNDNDKNAISYFIHEGTPTTIILGSGERAGVLNSYLSVFEKLPRNVLEWQDIIKIANGRWPDERNLESEKNASEVFFSQIYRRNPNMDNPNDSAAVTVIAYGLRPGNRNMESEKKAIDIYRSIFQKSPTAAVDWDLVRAIAYSGAVR